MSALFGTVGIGAILIASIATTMGLAARYDQDRLAVGRLLSYTTQAMVELDQVRRGKDERDLDGDIRGIRASLAQIDDLRNDARLAGRVDGFFDSCRRQTAAYEAGDTEAADRIDATDTHASEMLVHAEADRIRESSERRGHDAKLTEYGLLALTFAFFGLVAAGLFRRVQVGISRLAGTERERCEAEAGQRRYRFLYELGEAKRGARDAPEAVEITLRMLVGFLGADGAAFGLVKDGEPHSAVSVGRDDGEAGPSSEVVEALLAGAGSGNLVVPVVRSREVQAILGVAGAPSRVWTDEESSLADEIAARCYAQLMVARAEIAAEESEAHARFLLDAFGGGIWEWDHATDDLLISDGMYGMLGLDPPRFHPTRESLRALIHPDDVADHTRVLQDSQRHGAPFALRIRLRRADGEYLTVYAQGRTQRDEAGRPIRTVVSVTDLTELFEAERQSRQSVAILAAQIEASIDGILIVDAQGKKVLQNRRMTELWGMPPEVAAASDDAVQIEFVLAQVKDSQTFLHIVQDLYAHPLKVRRDEIELKNGTILDRHSGPAVGADGIVYGRIWTFRDVTDRMRAIESVRRNEERLARLMESMPQIVWSCLPDGWNMYFNHRWTEYTGLSEDESGGHAWIQAFHPDDQTTGSHAVREAVPYEVECRLRGVDGLYRWFLIRGIPMCDAEGNVAQWFGTCTDIDDLKLSEEVLRESHDLLETRVEERTRDLLAATQEAERANAAKSEFLSRMSHELRTPLNAILGFGQILEQEPLDEWQRESVEYILKGGRHLLGLINEILDLSRVEAGHSDLTISPVSLAEVLEESFVMVQTAAAGREIVLERHRERFAGVFVLADRQRLKQVLINLLSNAVKYNRHGGTISALGADDGSGSFRIAIRDTGLGISEEGLQKLFTPFERLNAEAGVEGTGLGLFFTQKLVAAMGARLSVESAVGEGSTFTVELERAGALV